MITVALGTTRQAATVIAIASTAATSFCTASGRMSWDER